MQYNYLWLAQARLQFHIFIHLIGVPQNRADVKVLLLPISSGANGLNLVEASHVILVEPILNPAQELQATHSIPILISN